MDLKTLQEFLALQRQAEGQCKPLSEVLEEKIQEESKRLEKEDAARLLVQIMPHNVVGGDYGGRELDKVEMPKAKALELAELGIVRIILDPSDEIQREDKEAIAEAIEEQLQVRRTHDREITKTGKPKGSRLSNIAPLQRAEAMEDRINAREENPGARHAPAGVGLQPGATDQSSRRAARAS